MNKKIKSYIFMLFVAAIIAGIYGVVHNQISYSLSHEYFTKFKFIQFGIPWAQDIPRIGAAYVGFLASWWMGVLICMVLGLFGMRFETSRDMISYLLKSFCIVVIVALLTGLTGLTYGYYEVNEQTISAYTFLLRNNVADPVQFVRVGFMHDASYIGGGVGLIFGIAYLVISRKRLILIVENNKIN